MHYRMSCPSCSMNASTADHRHFRPAGVTARAELRRCRNCGEIIELADDNCRNELSRAS